MTCYTNDWQIGSLKLSDKFVPAVLSCGIRKQCFRVYFQEVSKMSILNLTQHVATPDQLAAGVVEPPADLKKEVQVLLTVDELPTQEGLRQRAKQLTEIAVNLNANRVMLGGAPFLMGYLEWSLEAVGIKAFYSFSKREVVEVTSAEGRVEKKALFKHAGWVEV
jgi:hypothetical protein